MTCSEGKVAMAIRHSWQIVARTVHKETSRVRRQNLEIPERDSWEYKTNLCHTEDARKSGAAREKLSQQLRAREEQGSPGDEEERQKEVNGNGKG